jgi:hypothetical protein
MARKKTATPPNPVGRPTKYTPETIKAVTDAIGAGMSIEDSCVYADIAKETFYTWKIDYPEFSDAVKKAEINGKLRRILRIDKAGKDGHWQADAWYLERKFPEEYGRKLTLNISPEHAALLQLAGLTIVEAWKNLMEAIAQEVYESSNTSDLTDE